MSASSAPLVLAALSLASGGPVAASAPQLSARAGEAVHPVIGFKVVRELPASWTIERFRRIARAKPAPEGHVWYVLRGTTANTGERSRSVNVTTAGGGPGNGEAAQAPSGAVRLERLRLSIDAPASARQQDLGAGVMIRAYWCGATVSTPEQQRAALAACRSLRPRGARGGASVRVGRRGRDSDALGEP